MSHQVTRMIPRAWSAALLIVATAVSMDIATNVGSGRLGAEEPLPTENVLLLSIPAADALPPVTPSPTPLTPVDTAELSEDDAEAMLRGPVHEAFAEQVNPDPLPGLIITAKPPEPVEEVPPEVRPEGRTVEWISGYWAWDDDREDFMWVSGIWREVPQGFRWLPGYWTEVEGGHQWVAGTWVSTATAEIEYLEKSPPQSLEQGPVGIAPTVEHIWIPGCWNWTQNRYVWRPGYWSGGYSEWVWVPARYQWTPRGFYYCNGYWDYPLERRGVLFAPCYFRRQIYTTRHVRFTPRIVVASHLLQFHFWVRPRHHHYYFGDYYSTPYASRGIMPWHHYHRQHHGSDPLFCHYSRGNRSRDFYSQRTVQFNLFVNNPERRPARTLRDQDDWGHQHGQDRSHEHSRLGNRLQNLVDSKDQDPSGLRFVKLEPVQRQHAKSDAAQLENLVRHRREAEIAVVKDRHKRHAEGHVANSEVSEQTKPPADIPASAESRVSERAKGSDNERKRVDRKVSAFDKERPQTAENDRVRGERPEKLTLPPVVQDSSLARTKESNVSELGREGSVGSQIRPETNNRREKNIAERSTLSADRLQGRERRGGDSARHVTETASTDSGVSPVPANPVTRGETPKGVDLLGRGTRQSHGNTKTVKTDRVEHGSKTQELPQHRTDGSSAKSAHAALPEVKTGVGRRQEDTQSEQKQPNAAGKTAREAIPQNRGTPPRPAVREDRNTERADDHLENSTRRLNGTLPVQRDESTRGNTPGGASRTSGDLNGNDRTTRSRASTPGIQSRTIIAPERTTRPESIQKREGRPAPASQESPSFRTNRGTEWTPKAEGRQSGLTATPERTHRGGDGGAASSGRSREPATRASGGGGNKSEGRQRGRAKP